MDLAEILKDRRSIRAFKEDPVEPEILKKLVLEAGIWAPSGGNAQTWRFIIVNEKGLLKRIKMVSPGLLGNPPALIVVCQDMEKAYSKGDRLGRDFLSIMDSAMAAQNIMLLAFSLNLGTCPIASFHPGALQKILHLPEHVVPHLIISVGYPQSIPQAPPRETGVVWFNGYS